MQFRMLTLMLAVSALCALLALAANIQRIPPGALSAAMAPVGIVIAVMIALWRNAQIPTKILLAVLFMIGWGYVAVYVELVLAIFRSLASPDAGLASEYLLLLVGVFAAPIIVLCMLLLRSWLWAWHDRFDD